MDNVLRTPPREKIISNIGYYEFEDSSEGFLKLRLDDLYAKNTVFSLFLTTILS